MRSVSGKQAMEQASPAQDLWRQGTLWTLAYWTGVYLFLTLRMVVNPQPFPGIQAALRMSSVLVAVGLCVVLMVVARGLRHLSDSARVMMMLGAAIGAHVVHGVANYAIFYILPGLWEPKYGPLQAIGSNLLEFFWLFPGWALVYLILERRLRAAEGKPKTGPVLWATERGAKIRVPLDLIRWLESEGDYVRLHTPGKSYLVRMTLGGLERKLTGRGFIRIHRRIVVDSSLIWKLKRRPDSRIAIVLETGEELPVGRQYARQVQHHLSASQPLVR